MSKQSQPSVQELKFVYEKILSGYTDEQILNAYSSLVQKGFLFFPLRNDIRFVKARRRELEAAESALEERIKKKVDPVITQSRQEHFADMAEIAKSLLESGLGTVIEDEPKKGKYKIVTLDEDIQDITHKELSDILTRNVESAWYKYGEWKLECFMRHLEAEYPELQSKAWHVVAAEHPYEFIDVLRILAGRKIFKGKCPVCEDG